MPLCAEEPTNVALARPPASRRPRERHLAHRHARPELPLTQSSNRVIPTSRHRREPQGVRATRPRRPRVHVLARRLPNLDASRGLSRVSSLVRPLTHRARRSSASSSRRGDERDARARRGARHAETIESVATTSPGHLDAFASRRRPRARVARTRRTRASFSRRTRERRTRGDATRGWESIDLSMRAKTIASNHPSTATAIRCARARMRRRERSMSMFATV